MKEQSLPHGTLEWADFNVNYQIGCEHGCLYCYASQQRMRIHKKNGVTRANWLVPKINIDKVNKQYQLRRHSDGTAKTVMTPSSHDITPGNIEESITVQRKLLDAGQRVLIVTKPHLACVEAMCAAHKDHKERVLFRFTIGSKDNKTLKFWEPGAPSFEERFESLKYAYQEGYQTSVSSEPMLDDNIDAVIKNIHPYVTDSIWLGKANRLRGILTLNCSGDLLEQAREKGEALIALQNDENIRALYRRYQCDPLIRWKDSIRKVVGI